MENKKRKLSDLEEFAIIREVYFEKDFKNENIDQTERLERLASKIKNTNKLSQ